MGIIFLGAAASAAVGYPTMAGLRKELISKMTSDTRLQLLYEFLRNEHGDAETVLQNIETVDALKGLGRIFQEDASSVTLSDIYGKKQLLPFRQFVDLCHSLRGAIQDLIFDVYQFRSEFASRFGLYSQLLATFASAREYDVYTTNYDR